MASKARPYWDAENGDDDINISMVSSTSALIQPLSSLSVSAWKERGEKPSTASSHNFPSASNPFAALSLAFGEVSEKGSTFVPFRLVQRYPRMYVGHSNRGPATQYFTATLLRGRVWDLFSLRDPTAARNPLLFVPTVQFEQYLNIANHELRGHLAIPRGATGARFTLTFGEWDTPRPYFLGRVNDTSSFEALKARADELPANDLSHLTPACYQRYLDKVDKIYGSLKTDDEKKKSEAARQKRIQRQKDSGRMLKRVQRYLGLRQAALRLPNNSLGVTGWGVLSPPPFKPRESVRFVCVDVEAYERDVRLVTEVGLAVLDTKDVIDMCPGERGENWFSSIEAHHFIIKERCHLVNFKFVRGCPEAFEFGQSQTVSTKDISKAVAKILGNNDSQDQRPTIIVGHDVGQDLDYLMKIGYNPWRAAQIVDEVDTKPMFQRLEQNTDGRGLAAICAELGIPGRNYHNAGNDAVYTLRAMVAMAVKQLVEKLDGKEKTLTRDGKDEWSDGDMDDGGPPKRPQH